MIFRLIHTLPFYKHKIMAGNDQVINTFTCEGVENISLAVFSITLACILLIIFCCRKYKCTAWTMCEALKNMKFKAYIQHGNCSRPLLVVEWILIITMIIGCKIYYAAILFLVIVLCATFYICSVTQVTNVIGSHCVSVPELFLVCTIIVFMFVLTGKVK